ncbi:HAMP domain-containing sensor histidine kinase [uncultured Duncaniella sp.]|uniref:HAMP domain-containing sensor histidine kinase n=1 Tax=uncultured Duncaniella sp. TaxID=2768039 RepID=UPI0025F9485D|nr:HAMP domain-containing sensor histidine kinase [uncultured Duncaniella sp.]
MVSANRTLRYSQKLFLLLVLFAWALLACFLTFQYEREKSFKVIQLNSSLQLFNAKMAEAIKDGITPEEFLAGTKLPFDSLRVSVISPDGNVSFDNTVTTLPHTSHLTRSEISKALKTGSGYTLRRHSESTDRTYFYSAMYDGHTIVRSAIPYTSISISELLKADKGFIYFMCVVTLILIVVAYFATRKLGTNITRLNNFAKKAERGERIYADESFPDDELGEISSHIVMLYAKLQEANAECDRQHLLVLKEEKEKIRIKKQLTNNINHELKTPIASIQVCLETIDSHPDMELSKRKEFISRALDNCSRLRSLLTDVATITRMEDGFNHIEKSSVNLSAIILECFDDARHKAPAIDFNVDIPDNMVINGNPDILKSIFSNLLDNAIAYSGCNQVRLSMTSDTTTDYSFSFTDNGSGVESKHLPHLFERFYRIDKGRSRSAGGTGLGLAIVKNAVIFHDGHISVRNRHSGGLEFDFTLSK